MSWWGKVLGGGFGFVLGGPLGALIGTALGHQFDKGLRNAGKAAFNDDLELAQTAFFTATFSLLGHLAKADGQVSKAEIAFAEQIMQRMELSAEQRQAAIQLFREGKKADFDLDGVLLQLKQQLGRRHNLMRIFIEILVQAAYEDGAMHQTEEQLLLHIAKSIGVSRNEFYAIDRMIRAAAQFDFGAQDQWQRSYRQQQGQRPQYNQKRSNSSQLLEAYNLLGVAASASDADIKKAYRRLLSQHHPDKLVSRGLPEEMIKIASNKTHEIKRAYELIKDARPSLH